MNKYLVSRKKFPKIRWLLILFASSVIIHAKPIGVEPDAVLQQDADNPQHAGWYSTKILHGMKISQKWNQQGIKSYKYIEWHKYGRIVSYENGVLNKKNQVEYYKNPGLHAPPNAKYALEFGKVILFRQNGQKNWEKCYAIFPRPKKDDYLKEFDEGFLQKYGEAAALEQYEYTIKPRAYPCGEEIEYNPDGSVKSRKQHPDKCLQGCGEFKPFMPPGKYKVHATNVILRDKPSTKGKSLGTLQKGTELQVLEDTHKIETHDFETAPWVKVKHDGKTGYVFGGFLDSLERNDL